MYLFFLLCEKKETCGVTVCEKWFVSLSFKTDLTVLRVWHCWLTVNLYSSPTADLNGRIDELRGVHLQFGISFQVKPILSFHPYSKAPPAIIFVSIVRCAIHKRSIAHLILLEAKWKTALWATEPDPPE